MRRNHHALATAILLLSGCAGMRGDREPATASDAPDSPVAGATKKAGEIATQPVRDLGMSKPEIPPPLVRATEDPYSLTATATCPELDAAIAELNTHLGDDYQLAGARTENRAGKLAEAGGKAIVNSFIPFRGIVREITGAGPAQRRYEDAVDAGYARRGFLRGIQMTKACPHAP